MLNFVKIYRFYYSTHNSGSCVITQLWFDVCQENWFDSHVENLNNHIEAGEKMIIADLMTWQEDVKGLQGVVKPHIIFWIDASAASDVVSSEKKIQSNIKFCLISEIF